MSERHFYISGNVTIHPEAAIASDVVLQADTNSQLIIAAGVCIGSGSVLHAQQGTLTVDAGATLGARVLIVGNGKIGVNACIGSKTTIINSSIEAEQSIPFNSLIGDVSYPVSEPSPTSVDHSISTNNATAANHSPLEEAKADSHSEKDKGHVYGQASFNRMMVALFPTRQSLNNLPPSNLPSDGDT